MSLIVPPTAGLHDAVSAVAGADLHAAVRIRAKLERQQAFMLVDARVQAELSAQARAGAAAAGKCAQRTDVQPDAFQWPACTPQFSAGDLKAALKDAQKKAMRQLLRDERLRSDGRTPDQVRTIRCAHACLCPRNCRHASEAALRAPAAARSSEAGLLPRVHGCSMFTRGETQAIAVVTLGGESDAQRVDELTEPERTRRFYLNYFFPPSCVGEVRRACGGEGHVACGFWRG
jgi:polyribonucleotide nucleotidyltransferase